MSDYFPSYKAPSWITGRPPSFIIVAVSCAGKNEVSLLWLAYMRSNGNVVDVPGCKITLGKRTASYVQVKKWVGVVSVVLKVGRQRTLLETAGAVRSLVGPSAVFADPVPDVHIAE